MEYLVFDIKTEQHLKNVKDSLVNMAPEFNGQTNILICVEDESLFLDVRGVKEFLVPGLYGEILITFAENFVDEVKENILGANGDIIFINPNHVLGYGAYKKFLLDSMVYKYGLIACQTHNKCLKSDDLYDELNTHEEDLSESVSDGVYYIDNTKDCSFMIKAENLRYWLDDGNLGVYLKRLGYQNYVDKDIPVKEVK